jgi:hypothetical protein
VTQTQFDALQPGDVIVNQGSGESYLVLDRINGRLIVIRTLSISHADEWNLIKVGRWIRDTDSEVVA